jgi:hypothetical protein
VIVDLFNGFCHAEEASLLLYFICVEIGTSIGGKLLCHFNLRDGRGTVYFLFDPETSNLIRCDENGLALAGHKWEETTPAQFISLFWHTFKFNAKREIFVYGRRLMDYNRESR